MLKHEHAVENVFSHLNGVDFDYYLLYEDDSLGIQDRTDTTSGSIKGWLFSNKDRLNIKERLQDFRIIGRSNMETGAKD